VKSNNPDTRLLNKNVVSRVIGFFQVFAHWNMFYSRLKGSSHETLFA
jgi:hypothetical protein